MLDVVCDLTPLLQSGQSPGRCVAENLRGQVAVYVPEIMPNQTDLATENARLRLLLAQTVDDVEAARESPRVPQTPDPHISEERMRQWCDELMQIFDDEQAAIDGLMLLLWNVTHQKDHLDCIDLADRLIEHLYGQTVDCGNQCRNYLQTLPEKNYQQDAKAPPQTLAANA